MINRLAFDADHFRSAVNRMIASCSSCLLHQQPFRSPTSSSRPTPAEEPSELSRLPSPVHNGSAQLSYFIYSCTASNPTPSPHSSSRHHARVNLRPSVLCIRSTMSNSQRTSQRLDAFSRSQFRLSREVRELVEPNGIEPMTSCLQSRRSPS